MPDHKVRIAQVATSAEIGRHSRCAVPFDVLAKRIKGSVSGRVLNANKGVSTRFTSCEAPEELDSTQGLKQPASHVGQARLLAVKLNWRQ